jgi:hypothetical protein
MSVCLSVFVFVGLCGLQNSYQFASSILIFGLKTSPSFSHLHHHPSLSLLYSRHQSWPPFSLPPRRLHGSRVCLLAKLSISLGLLSISDDMLTGSHNTPVRDQLTLASNNVKGSCTPVHRHRPFLVHALPRSQFPLSPSRARC